MKGNNLIQTHTHTFLYQFQYSRVFILLAFIQIYIQPLFHALAVFMKH